LSGTSLVRGTLLLTAANLAIRSVSMLFQIYLSSCIGAAGLGLMQLISSVWILAMTFGSSGIRVAAMYLVAEEYGRKRPGGVRSAVRWCMTCGFILSSVAGLLLFRLAPWLSEVWISDFRAASSLRLLALFLPISCLTSVMTGYFTACGKIRQMVVIELAERLASVLLTVVLLRFWATGDPERSCCAIYAGSAITCAASFFIMYAIYRRDCSGCSPTRPDLGMGRRLLRLCLPLAANDYLRSGLSTLENLLIPHGLRQFGNSGYDAMSIYGVIHGMVFPVITFASVILFSLADVLVPELARCRVTGNKERIRHLTEKCLRFGFVFASAVAGLLFCLAGPIGQLFYRSTEAGRYIALFAPMILVLYLDNIVDGMHKGLGQQIYCVRYNSLTSFLDVLLLFFLLPRWGIGGFLFSFTVSHLLNFWLSLRRLVHVTGHRISLPFLAKAPLPAATAALLVRLLHQNEPVSGIHTVLLALIYGLCWALLILLTATFSAEDRRWLRTLHTRKQQTASLGSAP